MANESSPNERSQLEAEFQEIYLPFFKRHDKTNAVAGCGCLLVVPVLAALGFYGIFGDDWLQATGLVIGGSVAIMVAVLVLSMNLDEKSSERCAKAFNQAFPDGPRREAAIELLLERRWRREEHATAATSLMKALDLPENLGKPNDTDQPTVESSLNDAVASLDGEPTDIPPPPPPASPQASKPKASKPQAFKPLPIEDDSPATTERSSKTPSAAANAKRVIPLEIVPDKPASDKDGQDNE